MTLYFWARLVDRIGNVGPWYPVGIGVQGQSSSEADPILDMLEGKISETELNDFLQQEIEKIPGLQDQIDALDETYDPAKTYAKFAIVRQGDFLYQAMVAVPINSAPPNATYWQNVGQVSETVDGLALQVSTNTNDITDLDGQIKAQATSFNALQASVRDDSGKGELADAIKGWTNTAAIAEESKVSATNDEVIARRLTTPDVKIDEKQGTSPRWRRWWRTTTW